MLESTLRETGQTERSGKAGYLGGLLTLHKDWVSGFFSLHLPKQRLLPALSCLASMADSSMLLKDAPSDTASLTYRVAASVPELEKVPAGGADVQQVYWASRSPHCLL